MKRCSAPYIDSSIETKLLSLGNRHFRKRSIPSNYSLPNSATSAAHHSFSNLDYCTCFGYVSFHFQLQTNLKKMLFLVLHVPTIIFFNPAFTTLTSLSLLTLEDPRSHTRTHQSAGLLWTSDQSVAETPI
jgi:hypothetical protein